MPKLFYALLTALAVFLCASSAGAQVFIFDRVEAVNASLVSLGNDNFQITIDGVKTDGATARVVVGVETDTFGSPELQAAWRRTLNRCEAHAIRVMNRPKRFDLSVIVNGADTADSSLILMEVVGDGDETLSCTLLRPQ